jgi:drug/metabolite transporter (DMT)-like permease
MLPPQPNCHFLRVCFTLDLCFVCPLTICLFALLVLHRQQGDFSASKRFLVYGTVLTAVLALDDIFLFHEEVAPIYLHLDELIIFGVYIIVGVGFVLLNWREILSSEYALLLLALALFATSIALDAIPKEALPPRYFWEQLELFLEDALKFAGIATWLLYFARYAIQRIEGLQRNLVA